MIMSMNWSKYDLQRFKYSWITDCNVEILQGRFTSNTNSVWLNIHTYINIWYLANICINFDNPKKIQTPTFPFKKHNNTNVIMFTHCQTRKSLQIDLLSIIEIQLFSRRKETEKSHFNPIHSLFWVKDFKPNACSLFFLNNCTVSTFLDSNPKLTSIQM